MLQVQTNEYGCNQLVSDAEDNGDSSVIDVMTNNDFVDARDEVSPTLSTPGIVIIACSSHIDTACSTITASFISTVEHDV